MTTVNQKEIIEQIREIKKDQKITTDALFADTTDTIGENRSNFSQSSNGKRRIGDTLLNKIAVRFNINMNLSDIEI